MRLYRGVGVLNSAVAAAPHSPAVSKAFAMTFPKLLAHGALGAWDELIFLSIFVIFIIIMGVSWVRSRAIGDDDLTPDMDEPPSADDDRFVLKE